MTSTPTPDSHSTNDLLALAEQEISTSGAELAGAYRKATRALVRHFPEGQLHFTDFNQRTLRDWIVALLYSGCSLQTALYYLENVAAIYNKGVRLGHAPKTDAFRILKAELLATKGESLSRTVKDSLNALSRLAKGRARIVGEMQYYADLLLFSFYTRGLSIAEILALPTESLSLPLQGAGGLPTESLSLPLQGAGGLTLPPEAIAIARKYIDPRRRSIFPRGAVAKVEQRTKMVAHHAGIDTPPDMTVGEITARLWILAALRLGIPADAIAASGLPETANLAILSFLSPQKETSPLPSEGGATVPPPSEGRGADSRGASSISSRVANSITSNPLHWHVMKLRPHRTYDEVRSRLKAKQFSHIDWFYPQDEISRRIGKRLEFKQKPILPYVLFFRSKDTDIAPMFKHISDLAWCYRNNPRGAYAVIPRQEMERFQRTIGNFTPDYQVQPLGTTETLGIGRRVRVTGGPMAGYEGEIYEVAESKDPNLRLFRLHVLADNGIEWKMTIDARQLQPLD